MSSTNPFWAGLGGGSGGSAASGGADATALLGSAVVVAERSGSDASGGGAAFFDAASDGASASEAEHSSSEEQGEGLGAHAGSMQSLLAAQPIAGSRAVTPVSWEDRATPTASVAATPTPVTLPSTAGGGDAEVLQSLWQGTCEELAACRAQAAANEARWRELVETMALDADCLEAALERAIAQIDALQQQALRQAARADVSSRVAGPGPSSPRPAVAAKPVALPAMVREAPPSLRSFMQRACASGAVSAGLAEAAATDVAALQQRVLVVESANAQLSKQVQVAAHFMRLQQQRAQATPDASPASVGYHTPEGAQPGAAMLVGASRGPSPATPKVFTPQASSAPTTNSPFHRRKTLVELRDERRRALESASVNTLSSSLDNSFRGQQQGLAARPVSSQQRGGPSLKSMRDEKAAQSRLLTEHGEPCDESNAAGATLRDLPPEKGEPAQEDPGLQKETLLADSSGKKSSKRRWSFF